MRTKEEVFNTYWSDWNVLIAKEKLATEGLRHQIRVIEDEYSIKRRELIRRAEREDNECRE